MSLRVALLPALVLVFAVITAHVFVADGKTTLPSISDAAKAALRRIVTSMSVDQPRRLMGIECSICKTALDEIVAEIEKNSTQVKIVGLLEDLCKKLPDVEDCVAFFKQYGQQLVEASLLLLSPQTICEFLGFCNATSHALESLNQPTKIQGSPLLVH